MSRLVKVLVVGQTPPPWHGQAIMIDRLLRAPYRRVRLHHVRMGFSDSIEEVGRFRIGKLFHLFSVIARIAYHRIAHGASVLCYPPAGPNRVPLYRDLVILLSTRWMFRRTVLHYHAGGISELYSQLSRPLQWLFRRALFNADAAVRISQGSPPDAVALRAKHEFIVPYGIEDESPRFAAAIQTKLAHQRSKTVRAGGSSADGLRPADDSSNTAVCESAPLRILFVGILRESKGLMVLIEACGQLAARGVAFELQVMGKFQMAEFETQVHQRLAELEIAQSVSFLGELTGDAKWRAFGAADVFCLPTFYEAETFGIVLLEAMSLSLPVVATRWRGIPEIVEDQKTGFLVDILDAVALAHRLEQFQAEPDLREQMGAAGREKFQREFTVEQFWRRMEEVFVQVSQVS